MTCDGPPYGPGAARLRNAPPAARGLPGQGVTGTVEMPRTRQQGTGRRDLRNRRQPGPPRRDNARVSLTSELANPASPISRFLAKELPDVDKLADRYGQWAAQQRKTVRPRTRGPIAWPTLGHTIDHRIRVTLGHPYGPPIRIGVAHFAGPWHPVGKSAAYGALHQAGLDLMNELDSRTSPPPPFVLDGPDDTTYIRLCFVASLFEAVYRSGVIDDDSLLAAADGTTTLQTLLDQVPAYAVEDITAQLKLAEQQDALGWMLDAKGVCGPVFAGSDAVGGADADFIYGGELVDCKATVKPGKLGAREIYQLVGYLLLDFTDQYGIGAVSLYLSRQGAMITWGTTELLATLGATKTLPELRQGLARALAPAGRTRRR